MTHDPGADTAAAVAHAAGLPVAARAAARRARRPSIPPAPTSPAARAGAAAPRAAPRRSGGSASSCWSSSALVGYFLSAIGPGRIDHRDASRPACRSSACSWRSASSTAGSRSRVGLLVFAVAWGAIAAVGIALGVDLLITMVFGCDDSPAREAFAAVVQAPIVEEFAKGLGVFIIFVSARRAFDGPIDGIVYGGADRRGVRLHREHPVLRDQLHRGRRRPTSRRRSSCAASCRRSRT